MATVTPELDPITERQRAYIIDLRGIVPPNCTKRQASNLIDEILAYRAQAQARQLDQHLQRARNRSAWNATVTPGRWLAAGEAALSQMHNPLLEDEQVTEEVTAEEDPEDYDGWGNKW